MKLKSNKSMATLWAPDVEAWQKYATKAHVAANYADRAVHAAKEEQHSVYSAYAEEARRTGDEAWLALKHAEMNKAQGGGDE